MTSRRPRRSRKIVDFSVRKRPTQARAEATYDALVEACAWLLPRRGYAKTSTNHVAERAGVNIGSLYEYFPGKDAIVAEVAERLVERVLRRLAEGARQLTPTDDFDAVRLWAELIHETVAREKDLVKVFLREVPYTAELPPIRSVGTRLVELSHALQRETGRVGAAQIHGASLHLLINLVSSTILQIVLEPPADATPRELLDELIVRVDAWINPHRVRQG
jgi:AcrR family transcriptional regulator